MNRPDPSDVLYRNEVSGFAEAMRLVLAQCDRERRLWAARASPEEIAACGDLGEALDKLAAAAQRCRDEHAAAVRAAEEALARKWLADADPDVRDVGQALLDNDYSHLAI